jgi:hypothetical protein
MKDYHRRLKATARTDKRDWFRIVNKADGDGDTAYIEIFDVIGYDPWWEEGVSASKFIAELREITLRKSTCISTLPVATCMKASPSTTPCVITSRRSPVSSQGKWIMLAGMASTGWRSGHRGRRPWLRALTR